MHAQCGAVHATSQAAGCAGLQSSAYLAEVPPVSAEATLGKSHDTAVGDWWKALITRG